MKDRKMIPKIVHYCWFGKKEKPKTMKNCIKSWHNNLPDYEFMEWNEENFNINSSDYVRQAYQNKKYAFVSDVARIQALRKYGGIYMDTDAEVYKSFDGILNHSCVFGLEYGNWVATSFMACEPNHPALQLFEKAYEREFFVNKDGTLNLTTNVQRLTSLLLERGLRQENCFQLLDKGIAIYPIEYFSPYDYVNCVMEKTQNSYCAHLFLVSWMPKTQWMKKFLKRNFVKIFGKDKLIQLRKKIYENG